MKTLVAVACATVLFLTACASLESNAYKIIGATAVSVDAAMNGWGDYVRAGKANSDEQNRVRSAYEQYQLAMKGTHSAIIAYRERGDKSILEIQLDILDATKNTLIELIMYERAK